MKLLFHLGYNDFRNIIRDRMLASFLLFTPIILFLASWYLFPWLLTKLPEIEPYVAIIVMFLGMQIATLTGFITASITLDEKDEQVMNTIRVLPISSNTFLKQRLLFMVSLTYILMLGYYLFNGLIRIPLSLLLIVTLFLTMIATIMMLLLTAFARNKVEGFAYFKIINALISLPIISFFIPDQWHLFFWLFPNYWSFQFFNACTQNAFNIFYFGGSVLLNGIYLSSLFFLFKKKVFS